MASGAFLSNESTSWIPPCLSASLPSLLLFPLKFLSAGRVDRIACYQFSQKSTLKKKKQDQMTEMDSIDEISSWY